MSGQNSKWKMDRSYPSLYFPNMLTRFPFFCAALPLFRSPPTNPSCRSLLCPHIRPNLTFMRRSSLDEVQLRQLTKVSEKRCCPAPGVGLLVDFGPQRQLLEAAVPEEV